MGDIVGRLFREFAVTLSVTILVSAVVSLTLTPMMCAKLLRPKHLIRHGRFYKWSEEAFETVIRRYGDTLQWVLKHQTATLVVTVATLVITVLLYVVVPKGFFPVQDTGVILGVSEAAGTISFAAMAERQQALARVVLKDPDVAGLSSFIGVDGINTTPNSGRIQITLKPHEERNVIGLGHHPPPPARAREGRRHHALHAARSGPDGGEPRQPHAVPVHPRRRERRRAGRLDAPARGEAARSGRSSGTWRATSRTEGSRPTS